LKTRLAPTPSGRLHAGNAFSFVLAWLWARTRGGKVVLRIEDTDTTRSRPEWIEGIFRDLEWLGLDWDEGPSGPTDRTSRYVQSSEERRSRYGNILEDWTEKGILYPCRCSRRELSIDAPQIANLRDPDLPSNPYSGRCRNRAREDASRTDSWRLRLPGHGSTLTDFLRGPSSLERLSDLGDPVLRRADGCFSYHLAVCVDDADQDIDTVVRGRDLSPWSHLHAHLHALMGRRAPEFSHHGLLGGSQGERLAKRIGSSSLAAMRQGAMPSSVLLGLFAPLLHPGLGLGTSALTARELSTMPPPSPLSTDSVIEIPETT